MIRQERSVQLKRGTNRLDFRNVAAYIDPTTVALRVAHLARRDARHRAELSVRPRERREAHGALHRSGHHDRPTRRRSVQADPRPAVEHARRARVSARTTGEIHAIRSYENIHFPTLPGGLMTRPTLIWDVTASSAGREEHADHVSDGRHHLVGRLQLGVKRRRGREQRLPRRRRVGQHPESLGCDLSRGASSSSLPAT